MSDTAPRPDDPRLVTGSDGRPRCRWCAATPEYEAYHDREWGFPVANDVRLFEKLSLEAFQSGLSWRTILTKRENFRRAFDGFDFHQVALYRERQIERLLQDVRIVRHRGKIEAVINNAHCAIGLQAEHGSLAAYFWQYDIAAASAAKAQDAVPSEATALASDLKKRGWKFVGPTTVYAFMQAMGLVNDHATGCVISQEVAAARGQFERPKAINWPVQAR